MKLQKIFLLYLLAITSCKDEDNLSFHSGGTDLELAKVDSVYFFLDSVSSGRNVNSRLYEEDGKFLYTFLNKKNNSLYYYNFDSPNVLKKLTFEVEGENGVGVISSYHIENEDSIFLYNYGKGETLLVDSNSKILRKYLVSPGLNAVKSQVDSRRPLFKVGDRLFFNSWGSEKEYYKNTYFPETLFMSLNLRDSTMRYIISYPDSYKEGVWGVQFFQVYHDFNYVENKLILSFPIENDLFVYDLNSMTFNRSLLNIDERLNVEPLSTTSAKFVPDIMEEVRHQMGQSYYSLIKYDSISDIYIRVRNEKFDERFINKFSGTGSIIGSYTLIVLDKEFKTKGLVNIPSNSYYLGSMFFKEGKLHLEKVQNYDEDLLVFDVFDLSRLWKKGG